MPRPPKLSTLPADRPRLSRFVFFVLGAITTTAFAPFGWYPLLPVVLLPVLHVCLTLAPREAAWHLFWFGFGLFLTGTYWIYISVVIFGNAPPWIAVVLMLGLVLIMGTYFWITGRLIAGLADGEPWYLVAVAPAVWVAIEWLRGWLFSGFPWLALGYSQVDTWLAGWAPVAGVYGMSALFVLSVAALHVALTVAGRTRWLAAGLALAPWLAGAALSAVAWTTPADTGIRSTLIQGGIAQDRKWLLEQREPTMRYYRDTTLEMRDSELVVWPEVAIPAVTDRVRDYIESLGALSASTGQTILFGILERDVDRRGEAHVYNSLVLVDGERRQVYRKRHLVPFGEYFPVPAAVREWMRMMNLPFSDLSPGADVQPLLETGGGVRLGVAICYEDAYGAEQLYALPEAGLLINVSNDAWFGDSIAPHQHLQIARMRSLEVGRPAIRATNTGISAYIGAGGELLESGPQFQPVVMTRVVTPYTGSTPYARTGNVPVVALALLVIAGFWLRSRVF
ncbi:MAG: apolipoprotein N-acyltransferase [Woeseiaceae bacterium]|nr:apolipoprotein N-acyltransferase [Woeseiaceae bacterium]